MTRALRRWGTTAMLLGTLVCASPSAAIDYNAITAPWGDGWFRVFAYVTIPAGEQRVKVRLRLLHVPPPYSAIVIGIKSADTYLGGDEYLTQHTEDLTPVGPDPSVTVVITSRADEERRWEVNATVRGGATQVR